ncbi:hypothetical protein GLOIN_2v1811259 [Rhizophagus clarus]|uniref:RRM domain-containing protein n=1 Tax=Rhizophagus clarus TaxID=94130 RepID=A0A8H3M5Q7_9GLOM|nr:hypothetical protein GLOIN_2v1811259 [Rhizophagus clarus]
MASKAKPTLAEEQAIAKEKALTSNLESEHSLASDHFAEKKDGPLEDGTDHPVFKLRLDRITSKQVNNSVKKQTTFTCYASDSNEDAMVTDPPNQEDQQTHSNGLFKKRQVNEQPVDQPEIITISDDEDSFVFVSKLFTVYTESNNLPHVRKTDKAHEVLKLLQHYPGFEYTKPAHQSIRQENGKNKLINIVKAIFSNEDSYNKVLQERFHTKINKEDQDKEQRDQRKQYNLRLSGLPIGTTAINLRPILDEMNAMTCFIPRNPFYYKPFTYAYVNFKNEEDKAIAMKKKFNIKQAKIDKLLFISDPTIKRNICNNCSNPDHLYAECNIKKCTNKRNNTVKAAWKERTKLTAQNKNRSYAQVVKSNATPTNPPNRNNAQNQNKNNSRGKNPAHNNNKNATTHSPNNVSTSRHQSNNLVKTLKVQITQQFSELRTHIDQFGLMINQFRKERDERLKNITASVRKDPAYDDSSSSEEEQIENMLHIQRTLVQKVDQATSGLQGIIEGALQNFLGFATSSTTEQQFIPLEDNEEYLLTDNEEEEADVKSNIDAIATLNIQTINQEKIVDVMEYMTTNNIDILGLAETNVNKNTLRILEHTVQDKFKLYFTIEEKKGTGIGFLVKKEFAIYV